MSPDVQSPEIKASNVDKTSVEGEIRVRLCNYVDVYHNETITENLQFMQATATPRQIQEFSLRRGDVLITKDSETAADIGVPAFVPNSLPGVICGYHLSLIRPIESLVEPRYLYWALLAEPTRAHFTISANGVTRFALGYGDIGGTPIPVPTLDVQKAIVRFLDEEKAEIDGLIEKKKRLLSLLSERQSAVTWRVFDGLRHKLKWEPLRRHVVSIEQGTSPVCENRPRTNGEWGVLKLSAVSRGKFLAEENKALPRDEEPERRYEIRDGDLLITRSNTPALVGDACVVRSAPPRLLMSDLIYRIKLKSQLLPEWVAQYLLSPQGRAFLSSTARGSSRSMVKIRAEDIRVVEVPVVSIAEQAALLEPARASDTQAESVWRPVMQQISRLHEYRSALITAAVTGQIDVTKAG